MSSGMVIVKRALRCRNPRILLQTCGVAAHMFSLAFVFPYKHLRSISVS
jgi:hypothetical protein